MEQRELQKLRSLTSFDALVDYLRDELDWPIEAEDAEEIAFDYQPEELGIDPRHAVKIESIKQIRPLTGSQPWGVFYIKFESKRLPVMVLRRILRALIPKSRQQDPDRPVWRMSDLMFISAQGEAHKRSISFAHFRQGEAGRAPELRTFSWDSRESHFYYLKNLNLEALRWPADESDAEAWREGWSKAFIVPHRYVPKTAQSLAQEMAKLARTIREAVLDVYGLEHSGGPLHQLHLSFKMTLINDLMPEDFADMYAQTITYGLFSARATQSGEFAVENVAAMIPNTNPFLRELLAQLTHQESVDLDELGVEQLAGLLKAVDIEAILRDFGRQRRGEDPVVHFYETFLGAYDAEKKARRGVFYTPDAVVSFIVRSVDHILRTEFDCPDGLADTGTMTWKGQEVPKVQILDPATGTGTFLQYVIQVIWDTFYQKHRKLSATERKEKWNRYVSEHLLPRLHGFELMMAPYTIAHMKLGLKLKETGYEFGSDERLRVYLTNALQPAHEVPRTETPALAHEAEQASEVKTQTPITIVIGNPPYSKFSSNTGQWISEQLKAYYQVDGKPLGEKNPKWLQDDYVKFFRLGQWRINKSGHGILAIITNHGYLNNPTFRGMRQQLLQSFSEIYILDLHGSSKKQEKSPDGSKDENVFDIQQGVVICLMIKRQVSSGNAKVFHADLYGTRKTKYDELMLQTMKSLDWDELKPNTPTYLFIPQDLELLPEYEQGWSVIKIFSVYASTVTTARNNFSMAYLPDTLDKRIRDLQDKSVPDNEIRERYGLKDVSYWTLADARQELLQIADRKEFIKQYCYRPFDFRYVYYHKAVCERLREYVMSHMQGKNIAFLTHRPQSPSDFTFAYCTNLIGDQNVAANKSAGGGNSFQFPLFTCTLDSSQISMFTDEGGDWKVNLNPKYLKLIRQKTGLELVSNGKSDVQRTYSPEDFFHYMYAIFHSPTYRKRYAEFLKIDFPRLPLTGNLELFRALCGLGADLVALHLLEDDYEAASWVRSGEASPLETPITAFVEGTNGSTMGSFSKRKVYDNGRVYLDTSLGEASSYFDGVPEEVYNFHIGGYQVLYKWLYDRRGKKGQPGRTLTAEDIEHYHKIVVALKETMRLMTEIDDVIEEYGGWPIE